MEEIEKESDKFISPEKYYIVHLKFENYNKETSPPNQIKNLGKLFLTRNPLHQPLSVYTFEDEFSLIFSCVDENSDHYQHGSQQKIISEYVSYISNELSISSVRCSIIEFFSQIQIISYFTLKIYTNARKFILYTSNKKITEEDVNNKTFSELIDQLKEYGHDWVDTPNEMKFGVFLKLKKQNEKYIVSTLSENFDARHTQKYITYIFGSYA